MKNVVIIGGGTGLSVMLRGMKNIKDVQLSAVVTVADDGGSTGRIRDAYNIPAMGDIRNVMCAMKFYGGDPYFFQSFEGKGQDHPFHAGSGHFVCDDGRRNDCPR